MKSVILLIAGISFCVGAAVYLEKTGRDIIVWKRVLIDLLMFLCIAGIAIALYEMYPNNRGITDLRLIFLCSILWPIAIRDYREKIIPNKLILSGCVFWLFTVCGQLFVDTGHVFEDFISSIIAAVGIFLVCMICLLAAKNSIGMGDVKLFVMQGLLQGINGLFSALFFSLCISFFAACWFLLTKKKTQRDGMSFGPAVLVGTMLSVLLSGM